MCKNLYQYKSLFISLQEILFHVALEALGFDYLKDNLIGTLILLLLQIRYVSSTGGDPAWLSILTCLSHNLVQPAD